MLTKKLQSVGFNEKESRVYLALLELGEGTIQAIADKSGVKRTTVYDVVEDLIEKGLVGSTVSKKRRRYFIDDPRELEMRLDERKAVLRSFMPELLSIANRIDKKPRIRFYEGSEGIKDIYLDTLKYAEKPIYAWVTDEVFGTDLNDFVPYYLSSRVRLKIPAYVIAPDTKKIRAYQTEDNKYLRKTIIDQSGFGAEVEIDLYGDRNIGIMAFGESVGLIIESKKLFNTLKSIFDSHWNTLGGGQL